MDYAAGDLFEALGDGVAVDGAEGDDFEDQEIEGALGEIGFVVAAWFGDTSGFYRFRNGR